MTAFINTTPGDAQDVQLGGARALESERPRMSPVRKRKASEMLGTSASPGSVSPEPSESEAKKKYKKKMNVRHYRAQNKDAMTQLRDALPEHMRPPERQAKAYVTLSGMWHPFCPNHHLHCLLYVSVTQPSSTFEISQPRTNDCGPRTGDRPKSWRIATAMIQSRQALAKWLSPVMLMIMMMTTMMSCYQRQSCLPKASRAILGQLLIMGQSTTSP
ncbi:hypothetical protein V8E53_011539 [Lactarius tabidus]|jgi:hypothetical protein